MNYTKLSNKMKTEIHARMLQTYHNVCNFGEMLEYYLL